MTIAATIFLAAWRRIVRNAGGARAIPIVGRLLPEAWRKQIDKQVGKVGK